MKLLKSKPMKSRYSNVYAPTPRVIGRKKEWRARIRIDGVIYDQFYLTEREAAVAIDKILIRHGKEPKNILKHE